VVEVKVAVEMLAVELSLLEVGVTEVTAVLDVPLVVV
jgi:hypothetical protein